jgi:hypothetical protein
MTLGDPSLETLANVLRPSATYIRPNVNKTINVGTGTVVQHMHKQYSDKFFSWII